MIAHCCTQEQKGPRARADEKGPAISKDQSSVAQFTVSAELVQSSSACAPQDGFTHVTVRSEPAITLTFVSLHWIAQPRVLLPSLPVLLRSSPPFE